MEIGEVFYPPDRASWRSWLEENGSSATEIWVRRFRKATGIQCIAYDDLVEECLCFGWIDGIIKKLDDDSNVQRITPRKQKTFLSELNRQRIWRLEAEGLMTDAGRAPIADQIGSPDDPWEIPDWISEAGQRRREEMEKRLAYLIKNTRVGKMYGTIPVRDEAVLDQLRSRPT